MKPAIAKVKNILNLVGAYEETRDRAPNQPGMILIYGFTGAGKTTAIAWYLGRCNGIYRRAGATWTPNFMLDEIIAEAKIKTDARSAAGKVKAVAENLRVTHRPLFIDEVDYLAPPFAEYKAIEILRDIHDESQASIVMIGMEGFERKIQARKQLSRRIYRWVEFLPSDLADARTVADAIAEVAIADDLVEKIYREAAGSIALITLGIANVESYARQQGWPEIDISHWGERPTQPSGEVNHNGPRWNGKKRKE